MFWKGSLRVVIKTCNYKGILDIIKTIPDDDWKKDTENRYKTSSKFSKITRSLLLKYKSESYEKKDVKTMNKLKPYLDEIISEAKNFYGYKNLK